MANSGNGTNIDYLYEQRAQYLQKIEKYETALGYAGEIASGLQECGKKLANIQDTLYVSFTIDGAPGDAGKIQILIAGIGQLYTFLTGKCASQIQTEIDALSKKISSCDAQIAAAQKENENNG